MGTSPEPAAFEESSTPYPLLFRWLKRSLLIGAIVAGMPQPTTKVMVGMRDILLI
jgi:hypothetical protein